MKQQTSIAVLAAVLVAGWLAMAWASGMFLPSSARIDGKDRASSAFARSKRFIDIDGRKVAYVEAGDGEPLFLLHGCPFSAAEWEAVLPMLARHYRVIAPDWLGLGDTEVSLEDDYRLPRDVELLTGLMKHLQIERLVLTNIEAYDRWPSQPELKYLKMIVNPVTSPIVFTALKSDWVRHRIFRIAVHDERTLNRDILAEWVTPHTASGERWQRLRRFFRWQATLLVWGEQDTNFGPVLAKRLANDIPGTTGIVWMKNSAHMPMVEEPQAYADAVLAFMRLQ